MKKTIPALLCLLCALAAGTAAFFGCTGGGDNPGGDSGDNTGGGTENSYSITATDGEGYNIKVDKTSAEFGETVTVTVEVTDHDKYVDSVRANSDTLRNIHGNHHGRHHHHGRTRRLRRSYFRRRRNMEFKQPRNDYCRVKQRLVLGRGQQYGLCMDV